MASYLVSILDSDLRRHPEYERITCVGEAVIFEDRHFKKPVFCVGCSDGRQYYLSEGKSWKVLWNTCCQAQEKGLL